MVTRESIHLLEKRLSESLQRFPADASGLAIQLPASSKLAERAQEMAARFDEGKPAAPPSQARINALGRLRRSAADLTRKDWMLISWGLCDDCGRAGLPLEDTSMFERVIEYADRQEKEGGLARKLWFGLLHSYFAYPVEHPDSNPNWQLLREKLADTLPGLIARQRRPKSWTRALESHRELLTERAGLSLGRALLEGRQAILDEAAQYLPIPEGSWLWRKVIIEQLHVLFTLSDGEFYPVIPTMLAMARQHPQQTDNILSALLTRYEQSGARDEPHADLKEFAMAAWQNPQVRSSNRWALVAEDVRKMVLHWFAKADLEHFFSLLQGEGGVDRNRLNYWLRFVDQIGYTRIIMGSDAYYNRHPNFVDFRQKNKGRFSELQGGDTANNAFVMRIGDYYFVEFSGKGNACYVYAATGLPFNPDQSMFHLTELKRQRSAVGRILHMGDWEYKSDYLLRELGIFPGRQRQELREAAGKSRTRTWQPIGALPGQAAAPSGIPTPRPASAALLSRATVATSEINHSSAGTENPQRGSHSDLVGNGPLISRGNAVRAAEILAKEYKLQCEDHRSSGGAFWVIGQTPDSEIGKRLSSLGFHYRAPRGYWIK